MIHSVQCRHLLSRPTLVLGPHQLETCKESHYENSSLSLCGVFTGCH